MKNAILIHGICDQEEYFSNEYPSLSNSHWFPWLQKQLLIHGINTQTPEMPDANEPDYVKWKNEFEQYDINEETLLVGHSCGGGFLLRWLSENEKKVGKVVLVAPWLDPERSKTTDFFEFEIDPKLTSRIANLMIFVSNNDEEDILQSVHAIQKSLPNVAVKTFQGLGHFTEEDMQRKDFPELLEELIGDNHSSS